MQVFLHEELEEITSVISTGGSQGSINRGWTVDLMSKIGLTYGAIIESIFEFMDKWGSKSLEKRVHLLSSASYCFTEWKSISKRYLRFFCDLRLLYYIRLFHFLLLYRITLLNLYIIFFYLFFLHSFIDLYIHSSNYLMIHFFIINIIIIRFVFV